MAPLNRVTSTNVYKMIGAVAILLGLGLGATYLYLGFTHSPDDLIFGVDDDIVMGFGWLTVAIINFFVYRHAVRREASLDR